MLAIRRLFDSEQGTCVFIEDEAAKKQKAKCRHDFYQVGSTASLSIYAKKTDPELCTFKASSHQLSLEIGYEAGTKSYSLDVRLFGPIDPTKCALHDS
jgi:cysteine and histidine-rich domain-containing protein